MKQYFNLELLAFNCPPHVGTRIDASSEHLNSSDCCFALIVKSSHKVVFVGEGVNSFRVQAPVVVWYYFAVRSINAQTLIFQPALLTFRIHKGLVCAEQQLTPGNQSATLVIAICTASMSVQSYYIVSVGNLGLQPK